MRRSGVRIPSAPPTPLPGDRQQEREADEFAAEFLTPKAEIEPLLPRTMRIATLEKLSGEWGVSVEFV